MKKKIINLKNSDFCKLLRLPNFGKRYKDDIWVIFDQWQNLHLGLDAPSNQKILKGIYWTALLDSLIGQSYWKALNSKMV